MAIFLLDLFGSASIGVYSIATENLAVLPPQISRTKAGKVGKWLNVDVVQTTIGGSVIIGALACANSNGMILPHYVIEKEVETMKKTANNMNFHMMDVRRTAYGNMVLANDYGAIVDPRLKQDTIEKISDTLAVEAVRGEVAGLPYVGSLATATNKGVLAHPLIKDEERQLLKEVLKVQVDVGTVNCGIPYVATGLIGNSGNVVAGSLSTGPEMFIIGHALDVVT